jgi:hypothetical protein
MSPDGRFIAGPVPDLPGLWVASGCNGSGFSSSLAIGEALATWITSGAGYRCRCLSLRFLMRLPQVAMSHQAPARLWERS